MEDPDKTYISLKKPIYQSELPLTPLAVLIDDLFKNPTKYGLVKTGGEYIHNKLIYRKDEPFT